MKRLGRFVAVALPLQVAVEGAVVIVNSVGSGRSLEFRQCSGAP